MKRQEWNLQHSVGVKELDEQHQSLLHVINRMDEEQQHVFDAGKFSLTLNSLIHYAYTHFAAEERYLLAVNYPGIQPHILQHIDFIKKTLQLALAVEQSGGEIREELLRYLQDWYSQHVLGTDRHYIPFLTPQSKNG